MASTGQLFPPPPEGGLCVVVTGQVGIDKKPFLESLRQHAAKKGKNLILCNVGDMMYAEAPDVVAGRILDLPRARLDSLRRSVFKDIIATREREENVVINTHATFRWKHGLFPAYDQDHMETINADLYITYHVTSRTIPSSTRPASDTVATVAAGAVTVAMDIEATVVALAVRPRPPRPTPKVP